MIVSALLELGGGLAFFLYGLSVLSQELNDMAGSGLERAARFLTASPARAFLVGVSGAAALQSSSAFTAMLVGLADAGLVRPGELPAVLLGADAGSTLTPWLLIWNNSASLRPAPLLALVGAASLLFGKTRKRRCGGRFLLGLSVLLCGMEKMSGALSPLSGHPAFLRLITAVSHPLAGFLGGVIFTAVIQSSAAAVGILQVLSSDGSIPWAAAIPVLLGENVGTCSTALLCALGAGQAGRTTALLHGALKSIGAAGALMLLGMGVFSARFLASPASPLGIAVFHTAFNLSFAGILLPFSSFIGRIVDHPALPRRKAAVSVPHTVRAD